MPPVLGAGSEVRINAVVHLKTRLAPGTTVPIGWVAVGDPAKILPPDAHDEIWAVQEPLNFPLAVYGCDRPEASMERITGCLSRELGGLSPDETAATGGRPSVEAEASVSPDGLPIYRLLTGPDDASFCRRVSEVLALGYELYGSPAATFNGKDVIVAQAVVRPTASYPNVVFTGTAPFE